MTETREELLAVLAALPSELQQQVVDYAQYLLDTKASGRKARPRFYLCPVCFEASEQRQVCHGHTMIACYAERKEDCRPLMDANGDLKSPAPRWFTQSRGYPAA